MTSSVVVYRVNHACEHIATVAHARHFFSRLRGLLGTKILADDSGLLISPCRQVHTLGMRTPLDIVFLDDTGRVLKCVNRLAPCRIATALGAKHTLELAPGRVQRLKISPGDRLRWDTAN